MAARPYVLLGASVLDQVQAVLQAALAQWCEQWGVAPSVALIECARAWEVKGSESVSASASRQVRRRDSASIYLSWSAELPGQLERLLFPADRYAGQPSALAAAGAGQALSDLLQALASCAGVATAAPHDGSVAPDLLKAGSGAVAAHIRFGKTACVCVFDDAAVRTLLRQAENDAGVPTLPSLPALRHATALRQVTLRVPLTIGRAEVDLGSLMTLAVGDILRLDTSVEHPLAVSGPDGRPWFKAHLGTIDASLAIEIAGPISSRTQLSEN